MMWVVMLAAVYAVIALAVGVLLLVGLLLDGAYREPVNWLFAAQIAVFWPLFLYADLAA